MSQVPRELAAACLLLAGLATPALAQQGSVQVSGSAQTIHGDTSRMPGQARVEPDLGITWMQPGTRLGTFHFEMRGTRRGPEPHLGRTFVAWRDVKWRNAVWNLEAGDLYFTPGLADYQFTNLRPSALTFAGATVNVKTKRSSASLVAGRSTAWRNIFGSDPDTLGQNVALLRGGIRAFDWLEVSARASSVRTRNTKEFTHTISQSEQAGVGFRASLGPMLYVVADGSYVAYKRVGSNELVHDGSMTAGASFLHSRGWIQVNASRFSPGDFPVINYSLVDRRATFAAGEQDLFKRLRVFGGWENFRGNLDPARAATGTVLAPETSGMRAFGGIRLNLDRTSVAVRFEQGDRKTKRTGSGLFTDSDTGVLSAEMQNRMGRITSFLRYSHRENVESFNGGSYQQDDGAAQMFMTVSRRVQLFGTAAATRNTFGAGGGSTYYQFGGGGQFQVANRNLWMRVEGLAARNQDMRTLDLVARESFNVGVNGQIAPNTSLGLNIYSERAPSLALTSQSWLTRSTLRVTRSFATGSARLPGAAGASVESRARGVGSVSGSVFADWDADGVLDPDEAPLEGIPVLLGTTGSATTSPRGEFAFSNVPAGLQKVLLDMSALPVDFDPPAVASVQVELARGDTRRVAFGLIPLGTVAGRVLRDANGNGTIDASDEPIDGAVLTLDAGMRSEQARKGRYRFDAVRAGSHVLDLLVESLPEGATVLTERSLNIALTKGHPAATVDFLVKVEKRPEIRKVFPPKGGTPGAAGTAPKAGAAKPGAAPPSRNTPRGGIKPVAQLPQAIRGGGGYTIQIAALSQLTKARALVAELKKAGVAAFVVVPPADEPDGLYRVRVGPYATRAAANRVLLKLEKLRGEKLWLIRAR
jgi:cell division septation protein DedD